MKRFLAVACLQPALYAHNSAGKQRKWVKIAYIMEMFQGIF